MQVYGAQKTEELLGALTEEAVGIMLFLKSVESIQVLHWHQGQAEASLQFSCSIRDPTPALRASRSLFIQVSQVLTRVLLFSR